MNNRKRQSNSTELTTQTNLVIETIQKLSLAKSYEEIRNIVKHAAKQIAGSDGATFVLRDDDQCYYVDEYAIAPLWKGKRFPMASCISGWVMLNKKPAVIPDIYQDSRIPTDAYRPTFVKSLVMVPIRKIDPIGAIGNYWKKNHQPSAQEISLLEALADSTAIAMENVALYLQLEQRVQDRTKQLGRLNKELEAFVYSVSHDLRAPLRAIDGFNQLFLSKYHNLLNDDAKHLLNKVSLGASKMSGLIDSMLLLSRITKGDIQKVHVDFSLICRDILEEYAANNPDHPLQWHVDEDIQLIGDLRLFSILAENLLSNAIKFSSKATHPTIEVRNVEDDRHIGFTISDNGIGFHMDSASLIYEPFKRLHTEDQFQGTGIGLAIVKRIVDRHDATIKAVSTPGKGTTFVVRLPLSPDENNIDTQLKNRLAIGGDE